MTRITSKQIKERAEQAYPDKAVTLVNGSLGIRVVTKEEDNIVEVSLPAIRGYLKIGGSLDKLWPKPKLSADA